VNKMTVRDIDVTGKRVLVRVDFNVPLDPVTGAITDDSRIRASLPTIKYLLKHDAKVILMSHLGRPKGKVVEGMRLSPVARRLAEILGEKVNTVLDCIGPVAEKAAASLNPRGILMLENLRFHLEEEKGDEGFAKALAHLGDVYVNDAFGTSHRTHASMYGVTRYIPSVAGFLLEKEIDTLGGLLENPEHPFVALFGGAKVSDKVAVLKNIMGKVDLLLIGGGMAATFLKAKSYGVGKSRVETETISIASELMQAAEINGSRFLLPLDVMVADEIDIGVLGKIVTIDAVPSDMIIVDIGPATVELFTRVLEKGRTVFWNGPMGIEEIPQFAGGTHELAKLLPQLQAKTIVGGGSTAEVITALGLEDEVTFVSTGGGASLEFLGGKALPGVVALRDKI
jgi:phosphoglycerate kinase